MKKSATNFRLHLAMQLIGSCYAQGTWYLVFAKLGVGNFLHHPPGFAFSLSRTIAALLSSHEIQFAKRHFFLMILHQELETQIIILPIRDVHAKSLGWLSKNFDIQGVVIF
jgi:hypothetical protein